MTGPFLPPGDGRQTRTVDPVREQRDRSDKEESIALEIMKLAVSKWDGQSPEELIINAEAMWLWVTLDT
jgi:hypothetical protein